MTSLHLTRPDVSFIMPKEEKRSWRFSFLLAALFHLLILFGAKYASFIAPADYGIQGSSASMEVYMVAALPEQSEAAQKKIKVPEELVMDIVEVKSDMEIYQPKKLTNEEKKAQQDKESKMPVKDKAAKEAKAIGDGSSKTPGRSPTTFFSRGSSETAGKEGKYQNPPPQYPLEAQKKGWEGVVTLRVLIENEGKPSQVLLDQSSGHKILDEAAVETVKDWKFTPGHVGNINVSSWIKIPIRFQLQGNQKKSAS